MARIPVDMRTFRHKDVTFTPKGPVLKVGSGETPVLPNPIERETVIPFTARLFVGLSVGHEAAWTVEDVIDVTQRVRTKQGADPDASFLLQRGLYTDRANEVVREDSVQVVIFSFGDDQERFEKQMGDLAEALIKELQARGEDARFEIIGFFRDGDSTPRPQSLLIIRGDGRFENPEHPGTE